MTRDNVKSEFAVHETVVLTGFSKHMLDYLAREDIYRPIARQANGRGRRRLYRYEDIVLLRALHCICADKGKVRHLRESLTALRREIGPLEVGQRVEYLLFVQGNELCLKSGIEAGRQIRSGQMTFGFVIDLGAVSTNLAASFERRPNKNGYRVLTSDAKALAEQERQRIWSRIKLRREAA